MAPGRGWPSRAKACVQKRVQSRAYSMPRPNTLAHTTPAHQSGHKHHSSSSPHPDTRGWGQTATRRMPASTQRRRATKPTTVGLWRLSPSYLPHTPRRRCPGTAAIRTRPSTRRHARGSSEDGGSEALASSARDLATTTALHEQVRHIDPVGRGPAARGASVEMAR
jgi:hypothetical protein